MNLERSQLIWLSYRQKLGMLIITSIHLQNETVIVPSINERNPAHPDVIFDSQPTMA